MRALLEIHGLVAGYGKGDVLHGVDLDLHPGEVHCLVGRNGAGKTTLLKTVMGALRPRAGEILLDREDIARLPPHRVPLHGIGYVPQGRRLFAELTVGENLEVGLMARGRGAGARSRAMSLFPQLAGRLGQRAGTLSGGEQQMLAIARALCLEPKVMLMDEPTEGLQPSMIVRIREVIATLAGDGVGILLIEQRVEAVRAVAARVSFLENGEMRETIPGHAVDSHSALFHRYVGVGT